MNVRRRLSSCLASFLLLALVVVTVQWLPAAADALPMAGRLVEAVAPDLAWAASDAPDHAVSAALRRARAESSLHVRAETRNTMVPRAVPGNLGSGEEQHTLRVEGDVVQPSRWAVQDVPRARLHLSSGASAEGIDLILIGAEAYVGYRGSWHKTEDPLGASAPGGDYLGFLAAVVDVVEMEPVETAAGTMRRFGFTVDGPTYADNARRQAEASLRGKMPVGSQLRANPAHERMSGTGELWIDDEGRPRREIIDLAIPEITDQHHVKSHIDVQFSRYGDPVAEIRPPLPVGSVETRDGSNAGDSERSPAGASVATREGLPKAASPGAPSWPSLPAAPLFALPVLLLSTVLVRYRRTRKVYVALALAVTASMLGGPLLQAYQSQGLRNRLAETSTFETALAEFGLTEVETSERHVIDTTAERLGRMAALQESAGTGAPTVKDCRTLYVDQGIEQEEDEDGDGLTNAEEWCLGTDYTKVDTDGDMITDTLEVAGFDYAGSHWPLDPLAEDTNRDGMADGSEWFPGVEPDHERSCPDGHDPRDYDCDDIPNAFDEDNDGDGVTDKNDISPYAVYVPRSSVDITVTGKVTTYVDLQVRPVREDHLRLGTTALDWPDDSEGQIKDLDSSTDDLQLIPVMEFISLISPTLSSEYGLIAERGEGQFYRIWAPLQAVGDAGNVTAFATRLAFTSEEAASDVGLTQGRIRWLTKAKLDKCKSDDGDPCVVETADKVIASYTEDKFRVTGLSVTASRDVQVGMFATSAPEVSSDPGVADEAKTMFNLISGLAPTFLMNEKPTLEDITDSFVDPDHGATAPFTDTWGVDPSTTYVWHDTFGHRDEAMATTTMTATKEFLDSNFLAGDACSTAYARSVTPTLVSAVQETSAFMDAGDVKAINAGSDVNFKPIRFVFPLGDAAEQVMRRVQLTTYDCAADAGGSAYTWRPMGFADAVIDIHRRYPGPAEQDWMGLVDLLFISYYAGRSRIIKVGEHLTDHTASVADPDDLSEFMRPDETTLPGYLARAYNLDFLMNQIGTVGATHAVRDWAKQFGRTMTYFHYGAVTATLLQRTIAALWRWRGFVTYLKFTWNIVKDTSFGGRFSDFARYIRDTDTSFATNAKYFFREVYQDIKSGCLVRMIADAQRDAGRAEGKLLSEESLASSTRKAKIASVALAVFVTAGVLIYTWSVFGTQVGKLSGIERDMLVAQTIASTIITIVQAIITILLDIFTSSGIGFVVEIVMLIALYLIVAIATCSEGHCDWNPLNTFNHLTEWIAEWILQVNLLVEVPNNNGVHAGDTTMQLVPARSTSQGVLTGNTVDIKIPISVTLHPTVGKKGWNYANGRAGKTEDLEASWAFARMTKDDNNVPTYTLLYNVANSVNPTPTKLASFSPGTSCGPVVDDKKVCTNSARVSFVVAGDGRDLGFPVVSQIAAYLSYIKCWGLVGYGCSTDMQQYIGPSEASRSDPEELREAWEDAQQAIVLDVMPISAEELWTWGAPILAGVPSSDWNPDTDGDGLENEKEEDAATDANNWDTDGDGLSDGLEVASADLWNTSPIKRDTDGDGLSDRLELRLSTDANAKDTDQDGLEDAEEVCHLGADGTPVGGWAVRTDGIGAQSGVEKWVCSDPLKSDADQDGILDEHERKGRTSPYAPNKAPALMLAANPSVVHDGRRLTVLEPGDSMALSLAIDNTTSQAVTQPMKLAYPLDDIGDLTVTAQSSAPPEYEPPTVGRYTEGYQWDFGESPLGSVEATTATLNGTIDAGIEQSDVTVFQATVRYTDIVSESKSVLRTVTSTHSLLIDVDDPSSVIVAPGDGEAINGDAYVIGGTAHDPTSWPEKVEVSPDGGSTWHDASGTDGWAWTWTLPDDGVYQLKSRATDYVGRAETPGNGAKVVVDNTAPGATFDGIADGDVVTDISRNHKDLGGAASDLLSGAPEVSGLASIQLSIDDRPWRVVPMESTGGAEHPDTATWSYRWNVGQATYGDHKLAVRAVDALGQVGEPQVVNVTVDTLPPGDILSNARPDVSAAGPVALLGHVDDEANVPPPARPVSLETGAVDASEVVSGATVWLMPDGPTTATFSATWLGDVNGDRRADLAVGVPNKAVDGAADAGRVSILYGRAGGWPVPPDAVAVGDSPSSFVSRQAGTRLGEHIAAAGDVNGDGLSDLLIGDPLNDMVYLAFGAVKDLGADKNVLDFFNFRSRGVGKVFEVYSGHVGEWQSAAGDVNGDGYDDMLIGATGLGGKSRVYLVLGGSTAKSLSRQEYFLDGQFTLSTAIVAAVFELDGNSALATGVGDVNGDQYADIAVVAPQEAVHVILGGASFTGQMSPVVVDPADVAAGSVTAGPPDGSHLVALGDATGDGLPDLAYSAGSEPRVVFGRSNGWSKPMAADASFGGYRPAPNGFLAGVGDVNADGLGDLLMGTLSGRAFLVHGRADLATNQPVAALLSNAADAASAPYAAGADAACDGSSDLLIVPRMWEDTGPLVAEPPTDYEASPGARQVQRSLRPELSLGPAPAPRALAELPTAWNSGAASAVPSGGRGAVSGFALADDGRIARLAATPTTRYVDDDYCATCANDGHTWATDAFATIQDGLDAAVAGDAASRGDTVLVGPGVYRENVVIHAGKDYVTLAGVDPDAVFLDAGGGLGIEVFPPAEHGPGVSGLEGVHIEELTIRNASTGVEVNYGGKQGVADVADPANILVRNVAFVQTSSDSTAIAVGNAVNRSSSNVDIRHNTLVANSSSVKLVHNIPAALTSNIFMLDNLFVALPNATPEPEWYVDDNGNMEAVRVNDRNGFANESGSAGDWASTPAGNNPTLMTLTAAEFQDVSRDVFRIGSTSAARGKATDAGDQGYYGYHAPVWVDPTYCAKCENDGRTWGEDAFASVQAAIDTGAWMVSLDPGVYRERVHLVNGVAVYGSGAGLTALAPPDDTDGVLISAEGVRGAQVALVTLAGDGHDDGLRLDAGADVTLKRSIVRDTSTAVAVDGTTVGSATSAKATIVNDTIVGNESGVTASACGDVDVSNTILAYTLGTALAYEQCATTKLHTYSLYWRNGRDLDDGDLDAPTPGAVYADPRFVDASHNDYRPLPDSPAVDAGDPRSPHPPGTGKHTDIGYVQSADAAVYVSLDYCQTCLNDGLEWQVDAFDTIQDGLDHVPDADGIWTVGVAPGVYEENVGLPSGVQLVGSGADYTVIDGSGDTSAVTIDGATHVEVRGFTIQDAGFDDGDAGIKVTGASNNVTVTHNVLYENGVNGITFGGGSTGVVVFNTLVGNYETGLELADLGTWVHSRFNIFAENEVGIDDGSVGQVFNSYNLFWENGVDAEGEVDLDETSVYGDPQFVYPDLGPFWLGPESAAADVIPLVDYQPVPVGGGDRADLGYQELLAVPAVVMMGKEGSRTCGMGASGVASLQAALVKVDDASRSVVETAPPSPETSPASWTTLTISDTSRVPGTNRKVPASYWSWTTSLADGEGLYRLYTVPTDEAGNVSSSPADWYRTKFVADSTEPVVKLMQPAGTTTTAPAVSLAATVNDTVDTGGATRDNVARVWFEVDGEVVTATRQVGNVNAFRSHTGLADGTHTIKAMAVDRAGNVGESAARSLTVSTPVNEAALVVPAPGSAVTQTTVNLIGYAHYMTTSGVGEVLVSADGAPAVEATVEQPTAQATRWTAKVTLVGEGSHTLTMTARRSDDLAGAHDTTAQLTLDTVAPAVTIQPQPGVAVFDVTLTGTVTDATSGVANVEVSTDGGYSWEHAAPAGSAWSLDWTVPLATDYARFPLRVRASDHAGNETVKTDTLIADNLGPTPITMTTVDPAIGTHLVAPAQIQLAWAAPEDGSGIVKALAVADTMTDTVPSGAPLAGNEFTAHVDHEGTWFVHVLAEDDKGNQTLRHLGPWFAEGDGGTLSVSGADGSLSGGATPLVDGAAGDLLQSGWDSSIQADGHLQVGHGEWHVDTERMDVDPRSRKPQELWVSFDQSHLHLAWRGAEWGVDGTGYVYLDTGGGGTDVPLPDTGAKALPFEADALVVLTSSGAMLHRVEAGSWWGATGSGVVGLHGAHGDTEVLLPWADVGAAGGGLRLLAHTYAHGRVTSVFPTNNALADSWGSAYHWTRVDRDTVPSESQPTGHHARVALVSGASTARPLAPGATVQYAIDVENLDHEVLPGVTLVLTASTGLTLVDLAGGGGPAPGRSWPLELGDLQPGTTSVDVTTRLDADMAGTSTVTLEAEVDTGTPAAEPALARGSLTYEVDAEGPSVLHLPPTGATMQSGAGQVRGSAHDAGGIGVDYVEVRVDDGPWARAIGTLRWIADVDVPASGTFEVSARAVDSYANAGAVRTVTLEVDNTAPEAAITGAPDVATTRQVSLSGTARDLQPDGGVIARVEVQLDEGPWLAATGAISHDADGTAAWRTMLALPVHEGIAHSVRARSVDMAGNAGAPTPEHRFTVDNRGPRSTISEPQPGSTVAGDGQLIVWGYAHDGWGVERVDVSADGGQTWHEAALRAEAARMLGKHWPRAEPVEPPGLNAIFLPSVSKGAGISPGTLWAIELAAPAGNVVLRSRAVDRAGNVEPLKLPVRFSIGGSVGHAPTGVDASGLAGPGVFDSSDLWQVCLAARHQERL